MRLSPCSPSFGGRTLQGIEKGYSRQITDLSLSELGKFLSWCRSKGVNAPVIIGGWAVYAYVPKIGSIDIDVVVKRGGMKRLAGFFAENGYSRKGDEPNIYLREVRLPSGRTETIRFDIIDFGSEYAIMREPKIRIPVRLVGKYSVERSFRGLKIRVPEKELLLVQKAAAYRNREDLARTGQLKLPPGQREWNERKIAKDKTDIRNLIESGIDYGRLEHMLKLTGFRAVYEDLLKEIGLLPKK